MSLIQDALRRKQQEEQAEKTASTGSAPPPYRYERPEGGPKKWVFVLSLAIGMIAALGVASLFFSISAINSTKDAEKMQQPVLRERAPVAAQPQPAPYEPALAVVERTAPTPPRQAVPEIPVRETVETLPPKMAEPSKPVEVVAVKTAPASDAWPSVRLMGVLMREEAGATSAILNGELIQVGEEIDGVTLLSVEKAGVTLGYGAQTQFVRVGRGTK